MVYLTTKVVKTSIQFLKTELGSFDEIVKVLEKHKRLEYVAKSFPRNQGVLFERVKLNLHYNIN